MAPLVPRYNRLDCGLSEMSPLLPQRARITRRLDPDVTIRRTLATHPANVLRVSR